MIAHAAPLQWLFRRSIKQQQEPLRAGCSHARIELAGLVRRDLPRPSEAKGWYCASVQCQLYDARYDTFAESYLLAQLRRPPHGSHIREAAGSLGRRASTPEARHSYGSPY